MDTPPLTCFKRLQSRNQVGDEAVTLEYLELLDKNYKEVYHQMKANKDYYHLNYKSDYSIEQLLKALNRQVKCR